MLLDLDVLNGRMSLKFDKYVDIYTVFVDEDVEKLELNYKVEDNYRVDIINNENINYGMNVVYLLVSGDNEENTYTLKVYRESSKSAVVSDNTKVNVEVKENINISTTYIIVGVCFIVILFFFIVIFHPFKRKVITLKRNNFEK